MSIIPFLVFFYLLVSEFFGIEILAGRIGGILIITLEIALLGYCLGYRIVKNTIDRIIYLAERARINDEQKTTFVASVSHELRNPLAILRTNIFNLSSGLVGEIDGEQKEILDICYGTLRRIGKLVGGLLDLYKIETGMVDLEIKKYTPAGMIDTLVRENEVVLAEKGINISREIEDPTLSIWCDRDKIIQVLNNLLSNAVKYTAENGFIVFRLIKQEDGVRIECEDNGKGIPPDKLEKIFEKFERLGSKKEGVGLGLSIARNIIELHKGRLWAESEKGKGCKFIFALPFDPRK